jgi:dTDP-4-dehydrorhamnose reductase
MTHPDTQVVNCLVTGAGGLLGSEVVLAARARNWNVGGLGRAQLDVTRASALVDTILTAAPSVVVNCAAHTNAEKAEGEVDASFAVNALLPDILADASRQCGALFVHLSSTGCYGDWKDEPYTELDPLRPTTVHHRSKAAGEALVAQRGCRALVLRTGWLYGGSPAQPRNFAWQRLKEAAANPRMFSDPTQRGNPTNVSDVARQMLHLIEQNMTGTYNCVAQGAASRLDYVKSIVEASGLDCQVLLAPPGHFVRRAPVSPNETARNYFLGLKGADLMPDWSVALREYVTSLVPELKRLPAEKR